MPVAANWVLVHLGPAEWGLVALATATIFGIIGPRLLRDLRGWRGR